MEMKKITKEIIETALQEKLRLVVEDMILEKMIESFPDEDVSKFVAENNIWDKIIDDTIEDIEDTIQRTSDDLYSELEDSLIHDDANTEEYDD